MPLNTRYSDYLDSTHYPNTPPDDNAARTAVSGHYQRLSLQPWDAMRAWMVGDQFTGYLLGNIIKYIGRFNAQAEGKGGLPDLLKAQHYLEKLIELESRE